MYDSVRKDEEYNGYVPQNDMAIRAGGWLPSPMSCLHPDVSLRARVSCFNIARKPRDSSTPAPYNSVLDIMSMTNRPRNSPNNRDSDTRPNRGRRSPSLDERPLDSENRQHRLQGTNTHRLVGSTERKRPAETHVAHDASQVPYDQYKGRGSEGVWDAESNR